MIEPSYVIALRGQLVKRLEYNEGRLQAVLTNKFNEAQWYPDMECITLPLLLDHASLLPVYDERLYKNKEGTVTILHANDSVAGFIIGDTHQVSKQSTDWGRLDEGVTL